MAADIKGELERNISFYKNLSENEKELFAQKVSRFLNTIPISVVGNHNLTETDNVLLGSAAIIPIFNFPGWNYKNLKEILVYENSFSLDFDPHNDEKNVLGMVGEGAQQNTMVISLPALRQGFANNKDGRNTGIHEFVHLLGKADGDSNGTPYYLMQHHEIAPWLHYMHEEIEKIKKGNSEIDSYATTNEAEFFVVASEYFFEKPQLLKNDHPELFGLLQKIFSKNDER